MYTIRFHVPSARLIEYYVDEKGERCTYTRLELACFIAGCALAGFMQTDFMQEDLDVQVFAEIIKDSCVVESFKWRAD